MNFILRLIKNREVLRYLCSAGFATIADLGVFALLCGYAPKQAAYAISYFIAVTARFLLDRYWTFRGRSQGKSEQQFAQYWVISLTALGFGSFLFAWLSHLLFPPIWAKILSVPPTTIIAYFGFKLWVFRHKKTSVPH